MKIKCDFCKTEYNTDDVSAGAVQCAICGNTWRVAPPPRKNTWLMFFASLCALLSAIIFAIAVITHHQATTATRGPLVAAVSAVDTTTDENGATHIVVSGTITNVSDEIYGMPDLIIVSTDDDGRVLAQQKFMPSATLLDSGASVDFKHILSPQPAGVKKISAHLAEFQVPSGEKE
ncbi:MAG: hypothetical protein J6L47_04370 [Alphaproteobacteria bacterium]|nr:hypothetical protein [Alphaproteobacteria bacterium]